jgi:hypothetical protein
MVYVINFGLLPPLLRRRVRGERASGVGLGPIGLANLKGAMRKLRFNEKTCRGTHQRWLTVRESTLIFRFKSRQ